MFHGREAELEVEVVHELRDNLDDRVGVVLEVDHEVERGNCSLQILKFARKKFSTT